MVFSKHAIWWNKISYFLFKIYRIGFFPSKQITFKYFFPVKGQGNYQIKLWQTNNSTGSSFGWFFNLLAQTTFSILWWAFTVVASKANVNFLNFSFKSIYCLSLHWSFQAIEQNIYTCLIVHSWRNRHHLKQILNIQVKGTAGTNWIIVT